MIIPEGTAPSAPVSVLLVDDSAMIRGLLTRILSADAGIRVVAGVGDGRAAVEEVKRRAVDIVVLDIEMPVMDGLTALPLILAARPGVQVLMASTLTQRAAKVTIEALSLGAADYLAKPSAASVVGADDFKRELVAKVKKLGARAQRASAPMPLTAARPDHVLRPPRRPQAPAAIAIGASTGGPQALEILLRGLDANVTQPIFVTQHMPPTFTAYLAERLAKTTGRACIEAGEGVRVAPRHVYVAPGDRHMLAERKGDVSIRLSKDPPENFCRPAIDPMLRSLQKAYGASVLVVILTGMGQDGLRGVEPLAASGATVVAQDEATSVIWGMPGAVALAGLCNAVLPLGEIAGYVNRLAVAAA